MKNWEYIPNPHQPDVFDEVEVFKLPDQSILDGLLKSPEEEAFGTTNKGGQYSLGEVAPHIEGHGGLNDQTKGHENKKPISGIPEPYSVLFFILGLWVVQTIRKKKL